MIRNTWQPPSLVICSLMKAEPGVDISVNLLDTDCTAAVC